ncbi:MAG: TRAP transporter large permease subunit, partial [Gammaproteobacteria bacterium]|nr:TRAP transporter large permease subunit [Gammaproteobacteria bacterium]
VVVVPIVAPILLADPGANVTAVWLGVMIGLNMQTSFLTPPFGFALFYLRGVAPAIVKTFEIYRGAAVFILLQLAGLAIVGLYPSLVTYLPNRIFLSSENAPPPINPKLQHCLEVQTFATYDRERARLLGAITAVEQLDWSALPDKRHERLKSDLALAASTFDLVAAVRAAEAATAEFEPEYRALRNEVRDIEARIRRIGAELDKLQREERYVAQAPSPEPDKLAAIAAHMTALTAERAELETAVPTAWADIRSRYEVLASAERKARLAYRNNVDSAYDGITALRATLGSAPALAAFAAELPKLRTAVQTQSPEAAMAAIKAAEKLLSDVADSSRVKSRLSRARRALRGDSPKVAKSLTALDQAAERLAEEIQWRTPAASSLLSGLDEYDAQIRGTIGLRKQPRLADSQVSEMAWCQSAHRDISLKF